MFVIYILWGAFSPDERPVRYEFKTQELLDAFLYGADEAYGWMDMTTLKPGEDCPCEDEDSLNNCILQVGHEGPCDFTPEDDEDDDNNNNPS